MPKKRKKKTDEERYVLSPLGCAVYAAHCSGLIPSIDDPRIDTFWKLFTSTLEEQGYIQKTERK